MMRHSKFACFILTHGRPDNQKTYATLRRFGYTGKIYLIIDDEDITGDKYREKYGDEVITFCKEEAARETDRGDVIQKKNTVLFARNMCHKISEQLGLEYFLELDDDYKNFQYRYVENGRLPYKYPTDLDAIFDCYLDFLEVSGALSVCLVQNGDYMGGAASYYEKSVMRKAMNAFFCKMLRPFNFVGRMNDDVNTYVTLGHKGKLFFTIGGLSVDQMDTQQQGGGLTDMYKENGTYMKSFYTVMMCPSAVKVSTINGQTAVRIHHRIDWNRCAPKILNPKCKKG